MSVPAGIMQALQQGGGGDGGAGGAGPGAPATIQIPGPGPQDGGAPGKSDGDWEQDLQAALAALRELADDATDHIETNTIDKCIAALSALTANRQKGAESAFGIQASHKAMSRAY